MKKPEPQKTKRVLYPVVLSVSDKHRNLERKEQVRFLSRHARRALQISADRTGVTLGVLLKNESGMPLPFNGINWSITHKPEYVAGVVSNHKIGI